MADISSSNQKINDIEVSADAGLTEAFFDKVGGSVNYLIDATASNAADITALQTPNVNKASPTASGTISGTGVLATITLTPATTNVLIVPTGVFFPALGGTQYAFIEVKRGGTILYTYVADNLSSTGGQSCSLSSVLDTGSTADSSNTYTINVSSYLGTVKYVALGLSVIDVK